MVGAYIARPLLREREVEVSEKRQELSVLEAERDRILSALQELELDSTMGKIPPDDYQASRQEWMVRGARVLRQIDEITLSAPLHMAERRSDREMEMELESAVARLRGEQGEAVGGFCGQCGEPLVAGDRFCSHCGAPVEAEVGS
jgi:hypothetical protein